jgi:hypothetical protein
MMRHIARRLGISVAAVVLVTGPPAARGQTGDDLLDRHARMVNEAATTPAGQARVASRLAHELNVGSGLTPGPYTAASLQAQRTENGWGWGEVLIANRLAQALAPTVATQNPTLTPAQALAQATAQVTAARQQGMGWGAIANASGTRLGGVVSSVEKTAKAVERADQAASGKAGKSGPPGPAGQSDKGAKGDSGKGSAEGRGSDVAGGGRGGPGGGGPGGGGPGGGGPGGGGPGGGGNGGGKGR